MRKQHEAAWAPKSRVVVVTDSACDLPAAIMDERQIHFVPMAIRWGRQLFLDKLTLRPDRFYELLEREKAAPTTAVPPPKSFLNLFSYLAGHYDSIIAVSLSSGLSGVHDAFRRAAEALPGRKISVISSRSISAGQGLIVARASELALAGLDHDEIVRRVESWTAKTHLLIDVPTLKHLVRGGRVGPVKGWLARLLGLRPLLSLGRDGKVESFGKAFSRRQAMARVLDRVRELSRRGEVWGYAVVHAAAPGRASAYRDALTPLLGRPPAFVMDVSPVIGVHCGAGAAAVALLME
jgi:DegV family protein with EDD domain